MSDLKKLALVEDSPDSAELFGAFLDNLCDRFEVSSFSNGLSFLETFRVDMYRVIILDISLPEIDGFQVLERIRSIDATVPVVAFTAHVGREFPEKVIKAGFSDVVTKPVEDLDRFCQNVIDLAQPSKRL